MIVPDAGLHGRNITDCMRLSDRKCQIVALFGLNISIKIAAEAIGGMII